MSLFTIIIITRNIRLKIPDIRMCRSLAPTSTKPFRDGAETLMLVVVVFWLSHFCSPLYAETSKTHREVTDSQIANALEERLAQDDEVPEHLIDISVHEGIVNLLGKTDNMLAKERTTDLAETVRGVRSVINRIQVTPIPAIKDDELKHHIVSALLEDPVAKLYDVEVKVVNGTVALSGTVQSWTEKRLVLEVVKGVRGVQKIQDNIDINPVEHRSDEVIKAEIVGKLASDVWISAGSIEVMVNDGNVTLSGTVPSAAEKSRATHLSWVYGVTDVDSDDIEVNPSTVNTMIRPGLPVLTNSEIEKAVKDTLSNDPRVNVSNISVESQDGLVTLRGIVDSFREKETAAQDGLNTSGVYKVINLLKVRTRHLYSDDVIRDLVLSAFSRDPLIDPEDIEMSVHEGTVYLRGKVDTRLQKIRATMLVSKINGVVQVVNQLEHPIKWFWKSDFELRQDIEDRLWWSPFVANQSVHVRVEDSVVTLTGVVSNLKQKHIVEEAAYEAGARSVINQLRLNSLR